MAQQNRVSSYDFLRGIAILGVISVHVSQAFPTGIQLLDKLLGYGAKGVQLFFFVSAITMCHMWKLRSGEGNPVRNFYIRRFLRIAPLFWMAMAFYLATDYANQSFTIHQIISTFTFTHAIWPTSINAVVPGGWSIGVEMSFYLIFPALIKTFRNRAHLYLYAAVFLFFLNSLAIEPLLSFVFNYESARLLGTFLYMQFFNQAPIFLIGCYLYFRLYNHRSKQQLVLEVFVLSTWVLMALYSDRFHDNKHAPFLLFFLTIGFFAWIVVKANLSLKVVELFGENSYAIYLLHFYPIYLLNRYFAGLNSVGNGGGYLVAFLTVLWASYYVATLIHRYIESPINTLARHLTTSQVVALNHQRL